MAASNGHHVRIVQKLKIKLGEAKNLIARSHGSVGVRDVYCVLSLDQEQLFKSSTIEKTLDPFFGEEFQFDIPREFQFLSIYIYDRDRPMKTDKVIGKVSIKREDLTKHNGKDQWLAITPVDRDSEVQGKVNVRIQLKSLRLMNDAAPLPMVEVQIAECSDLLVINSNCDPYAVVTMHYTDRKQETKRTKTKKKTATPVFDETFFFESSSTRGGDCNSSYTVSPDGSMKELGGFQSLQISLFHDPGPMFGHVFLGEIRIPLQGLSLARGMNAWYLLQPRESSGRHQSGGSLVTSSRGGHAGLGSLRINLNYCCTHVFPSAVYEELRSLLLHTATAQPVQASVGWLLGEVCGSKKQEAAVPLTRVLLRHNQAVPFISNLSLHELSSVSDPNTIFRGNTLASKCIDELMKLAGHHYLKSTLQEVLNQVCREKKPCEVDPTRIPATENRETNLANLSEYANRILRAINNSALNCPPVMCQMFSELREHANNVFPNQREVRYSVISGFIFLRFFAPAILGPKLFDITEFQIDPTTSRTLTLISKTVQGVGNLVSSRSLSHNSKEEYMRDVFLLCVSNKLVDSARTFLEIISSMPNGNLKAYDTPVILREGIMTKRAQGRKKFGLKNFKTRFFRLNTRSLSYAKNKASQPLCIIPVEDILAVESVQESSFKCKNMFQLVQPHRTLYIQAANCVEEKEWMDLLTKVCQYNKHRLKQYHPGAYLNSHWQCCKAPCEHSPGCSAVSNYPDVDLNIQIDPERELECLFSLVLCNINKLKKIYDEQHGDGSENAGRVCVVLEQLVRVVSLLYRQHAAYRAMLRKTNRPGSKQAPIGDDNYLLLSSNKLQCDSPPLDTGQQPWPDIEIFNSVDPVKAFCSSDFSSSAFMNNNLSSRTPERTTPLKTVTHGDSYHNDVLSNVSGYSCPPPDDEVPDILAPPPPIPLHELSNMGQFVRPGVEAEHCQNSTIANIRDSIKQSNRRAAGLDISRSLQCPTDRNYLKDPLSSSELRPKSEVPRISSLRYNNGSNILQFMQGGGLHAWRNDEPRNLVSTISSSSTSNNSSSSSSPAAFLSRRSTRSSSSGSGERPAGSGSAAMAHCQDGIVSAANCNADFLYKSERHSDCVVVAQSLDKQQLVARASLPASCERSDTGSSGAVTLQRNCSVSPAVINSTNSNPVYVNVNFLSTKHSSGCCHTRHDSTDCVMTSVQEEDDDSGSYASVAADEPSDLSHNNDVTSQTDCSELCLRPEKSHSNIETLCDSTMYATGVDQCCRTVYQEAAAVVPFTNSNTAPLLQHMDLSDANSGTCTPNLTKPLEARETSPAHNSNLDREQEDITVRSVKLSDLIGSTNLRTSSVPSRSGFNSALHRRGIIMSDSWQNDAELGQFSPNSQLIGGCLPSKSTDDIDSTLDNRLSFPSNRGFHV